MTFKNKAVADKYEPVFETDRDIHLPCGCKTMLSAISLKDADGMVERGSNLIKLKPVIERSPQSVIERSTQPVIERSRNDNVPSPKTTLKKEGKTK